MQAYKSFSVLSKLRPYDLAKEGAVNEERIRKFRSENLSLQLLYGMERVDEEILDSLFQLAKESKALEKMKEMQEGKIVNVFENRKALHTATRDFFEAPMNKEATSLALDEVQKLKRFLPAIEKKFTTIVQIGIGGSDLGPRAIYKALKVFAKDGKKAHFISNVDPDDMFSALKKVDLKTTLVVSVSKSGTTMETLTNEEIMRDAFKKANLNPRDHIVAVTGKNSPMDDPSKYLESFYMWDYVGGRFSATSMVGGVTLGFILGFEAYMEFLKGANAMDRIVLTAKDNLPLLSALLGIWNRNFLNLPSVAIVPYSKALRRFPAHLQQCDMESNGKSVSGLNQFINYKTAPLVWGEIGTDGQHSFFQFLHQGCDIVPVEFIGFRESQLQRDFISNGTTSQEKLLSNLFAQSLALAIGQKSSNPNKHFPGNRPNSILLGKRLDPFTMGLLLAYFEHKVVFQGFIWNINSFDQEGVQLGKTLAQKFINLYKTKDYTAFPLGKAFLD